MAHLKEVSIEYVLYYKNDDEIVKIEDRMARGMIVPEQIHYDIKRRGNPQLPRRSWIDYAAKKGCINIVKALLDFPGEIYEDRKNYDEVEGTATAAASGLHVDLFNYLVSRGERLTYIGYSNALLHGHVEMLNALYAAKCPFNGDFIWSLHYHNAFPEASMQWLKEHGYTEQLAPFP